MNLTKLALKRPISCFLVILALVVFGLSSLLGFKLELTPELEIPMLITLVTYPGADPESVEKLVASKVEDAGASLSGVDSITTMSSENYCIVLFQYDYGVNITECHDALRAALETAKLQFPDDVGDPTIIELNLNSVPVLYISAIEQGDIDLLKVVNESVVPELESVSGVAEVAVSGGAEEYIKIELDDTLLKQYGLTMSSVAQFLGQVDFSYPAGSVKQGNQDVSVATTMEYNTVQLLKQVPLMTGAGQVITLQDVANVTTSTKKAQGYSRYNGQDNVSISVQNKSSFGTVNVCRAVLKRLDKIAEENPAISFDVTYNASDSIISSLTSVGETLALGVIFTMLVLFIFFGDIKASLIVGMSMPISLFVTLILMNAMGFSLNVVTMGSLVIAIGMMVDSSIVVIESCFRRQEKITDFKQAALEGTKEVTASIVASTITTIVVYLPLATMEGISGQMFKPLGYTIVFAMLASLVAAIMLVPLFYFVFKPMPKENLPVDKLLNRIYSWYRPAIRKILNRRKTAVIVSLLLVALAIGLATTLNTELFPATDEGVVDVSINFRSGTTLDSADAAIREWEAIAAADENVERYTVTVGSSSSMLSMGGSSGAASLSATLKKGRKLSTDQVIDKWNAIAAEMTNMDITISSGGNGMSSYSTSGSYEVDIKGSNLDELKLVARDMQSEMAAIDGVVKVDSSVANASTIAKIKVDPLKAMQVGMTPIQVGVTINNVLSGVSPVKITNSGTEYEVRLEYPKGKYDDLNKLMDLDIATSFGTTVPLRDIADIVYEDNMTTITKVDGDYNVSLTASLNSETLYETQALIKEYADSYAYPENVHQADSNLTDSMNEEFSALIKAILIAVFLVFLVMAMQFESPRFSFMVMLCIPFAIIGSFLFLFVTQSTISMISLMGFLMLMGIVVNNGILFVDSTNMFKREMPVEEALVETGVVRLRPILMTTLTTILSMVPMGMGWGSGENSKMLQGMALVIIGGLIASTALTLLLLPTFYMIIDKEERKKRKEAKRKVKQKAGQEDPFDRAGDIDADALSDDEAKESNNE